MNKFVVDISFWQNFFNNPRTQKVFRALARITQRTGHETGVMVKVTHAGNFIFSTPCEAGCDSMNTDVRVLEALDESDDGVSSVGLFYFHFHPDKSGAIGPSAPDLRLFKHDPFTGIGQVFASGEIQILMIRKNAPTKDVYTQKILHEAMEQAEKQEEILEILQELGYRANVITLGNLRKKQTGIDPETLKGLSDFSTILNIPSYEELLQSVMETAHRNLK